MSVQRLSHIGICVSDLQQSVDFYCNALGFTELCRLNIAGEDSAKLLQLPGGKLEAVYLERDATRIELLRYPDAGCDTTGTPKPMNSAGLSHLSLRVENFDDVVSAVEAAGGRYLQQTRVENAKWGTIAAFVTDPDGLRIELLQAPGDPAALPGT